MRGLPRHARVQHLPPRRRCRRRRRRPRPRRRARSAGKPEAWRLAPPLAGLAVGAVPVPRWPHVATNTANDAAVGAVAVAVRGGVCGGGVLLQLLEGEGRHDEAHEGHVQRQKRVHHAGLLAVVASGTGTDTGTTTTTTTTAGTNLCQPAAKGRTEPTSSADGCPHLGHGRPLHGRRPPHQLGAGKVNPRRSGGARRRRRRRRSRCTTR